MTADLKAALAAVTAAAFFVAGVALAGARFRTGGEVALPVIVVGTGTSQEYAGPESTAAAGGPPVICRPLDAFLSPPPAAPAYPARSGANGKRSDDCP